MATAKTPAEKRAALQRQIDELDMARLTEIQAVFQRPALKEALADLEALADPTDTTGLHRSASADPDALLANVILPLRNGPEICDALVARLDKRLNPPAAPEAPAPAAVPGQ